MTGADGASDKEVTYRPFGEAVEFVTDPTAVLETKGFIGERFDADAGLQYLNARYYDPKLAMFIQPDWFEVTKAGVGTNRYAYSFNDPVNARDPGGNNLLTKGLIKAAIRDAKKGALRRVRRALTKTLGLKGTLRTHTHKEDSHFGHSVIHFLRRAGDEHGTI